ncbi:hypothetical protein [Actinacidiphila acidipaludis]|uniref:Uncharacterized protein n=1 Tax=Actinacidiphila acidipaludis TaxID=2873382 RepID=A0ABS7Q7H2_9ACTN|nr:hypothetical protein [Streptomyces acidipaludis]MBY8879098.1 hypothetical protein [Streptomyces acidipaludis]
MPDRYRWTRGADAQVSAWIVQGAERLGLEELYRSAAYEHSYRLLWLAGLSTREQDTAHTVRFPCRPRLKRADGVASLSVLRTRVSDAALARSKRPMVEGRCVCEGTGWYGNVFDPDDPTTYYESSCPGHNPDGLRTLPLAVSA